MESEVGQLDVTFYGKAVSVLKPKQQILSHWMKNIMLTEALCGSYQASADRINMFLHRSGNDAISKTTLKDRANAAGKSLSAHYKIQSESILNKHHFDCDTCSFAPEANLTDDLTKAPECEDLAKEQVDELIAAYNEKRKETDRVRDGLVVRMEAKASDCVYISVDDIGVKFQKDNKGGEKDRTYVENTVCHIQWDGGEHYLTGVGMDNVFRMLLAFLLVNDIMRGRRLVFFTDGARCIKEHICKYFAFREYCIVLDWLHLAKKCKQFMSMGIKGLGKRNKSRKEDKKSIINTLQSILWLGDISKAKDYLQSLPQGNIQRQEQIDELVAYLDRKSPDVACYALRKAHGLRISSNRVEKANDIIVAKRQKHNGMAWSVAGSEALAVLTMTKQNRNLNIWIRTGVVSLKLAAA